MLEIMRLAAHTIYWQKTDPRRIHRSAFLARKSAFKDIEMGIFSVTIGVGNPGGGDLTEVSAIVDIGAYHTMLPESLLAQLRIRPIVEREIGFADGNREQRGVGQARIAYSGAEWVCPVIFGPDGQYLMGATTLEIMSLAADPVGKRLIPVAFTGRPF